ncbi:MAG: hypothetical protein AAF705_05780, partial [Bacteroidota bacterium]
MSRYFVWTIGFTMLFMSCDQDITKSPIPKRTRITQSTQFDQDTIVWDLTNLEAGLIIESDEDLVLDFQGAVLTGKNFGKNPNRYRGIAIDVGKVKKIHIKNAHFYAFYQGIVGVDIEHLILENCDFSFFYGESGTSLSQGESYALNLIGVDTLSLYNVNFKHVDRALQLTNVDHINIDSSKFSWLRRGAIRVFEQAKNLNISNSQFIYLGIPRRREKIFDLPELTMDLRNNYWAHLSQINEEVFNLNGNGNQVAYLES